MRLSRSPDCAAKDTVQTLVASASRIPLLPAPARSAAVACLGLIAALAENRTVAPGFEGDRGLLPAAGTDDAGALWSGPALAASKRITLLRLTAGLAPLGGRVAALLKERLVGLGKSKLLSAVAAGQLQVPSHRFSSSLSLRSGWRVPGKLAYGKSGQRSDDWLIIALPGQS